MKFKFEHCDINMADYNGLTFMQARALIIDKVVDHFTKINNQRDYEIFNHYNWEVNVTLGYFKIPRDAFKF